MHLIFAIFRYSDGPKELHKQLRECLSVYEHEQQQIENERQENYQGKESHLPVMIQKLSRSNCQNKGCTAITNVKCETCNKFLCFTSTRNCFNEYHKNNKEHKHWPLYNVGSARSRCHNKCNTPSNLTSVSCSECKFFLCFNHKRNCFSEHHLK